MRAPLCAAVAAIAILFSTCLPSIALAAGGNNIVSIDLAKNQTVDFVTAGRGGLSGPKGSVVYNSSLFVVSSANNKILRYSISDGAFQGEFVSGPVIAAAAGICFTSDFAGCYMLLSTTSPSQVLRFDSTGKFVDVFVKSQGPQWSMQSPIAIYNGPGVYLSLWVMSYNNHQVQWFRSDTGAFTMIMPTERDNLRFPTSMCFGPPSGSRGYDLFISAQYQDQGGAIFRYWIPEVLAEAQSTMTLGSALDFNRVLAQQPPKFAGLWLKPNTGGLHIPQSLVIVDHHLLVANTTNILMFDVNTGNPQGVALHTGQDNLAYPVFLASDSHWLADGGRAFISSCATPSCA